MEYLLFTQVGKSKMLKRIYRLSKIARKLASSGAINTIDEIYNVPTSIKLFFDFISIGSEKIYSQSNDRILNRNIIKKEGFLNRFGKSNWLN